MHRSSDTPINNYKGVIFSCVVLDGSNIITINIPTTTENRTKLSAERLIKVLNYVHKLGWPAYIGMKRGTYRFAVSSKKSTLSLEGRRILDDLIDKGIISLIDDANDDDWLIRAAMERNGWILSNDRYLDAVRKMVNEKEYDVANEINKRSCKLEWVGTDPIFILPSNHSSLMQTVIDEDEDLISHKIKEVSEINFLINFEGKAMGNIKLPINVPIGRNSFIEHIKESNNTISRSHFLLQKYDDICSITDLNSKNGTIVNGLSIAPNFPCEMVKNTINKINIGKIQLILSIP